MDIKFYLGLSLITCWIYICIAGIKQQHAAIQYFDKQYISDARAFTGRRVRGDAYLTNITIVSVVPINNNVTVKVIANVKSIGSIVFHDMKACDALKVSWVKQLTYTYLNLTDCPIPPGKYEVKNLELPPRNFPLPVPKGEGTLHYYLYLTGTTRFILHIVMAFLSS